MGIKGLTALLSEHAPKAITEHDIKTLFGRKVAVDASMSIYQFLIAVRQKDGEMLTNDAGETTSHLMGFFYRTIRMVEQGIKPMYVFDGKPPDLKAGVLKERFARRAEAKEGEEEAKETGTVEEVDKLSRRQVRVTKEHNAECQKLLKLMGIPVIIAPSEAEAQCAELARGGKVYAAGSEDMDTLTFNSPILLRHLTFSEAKKMPITEIRLDRALEGLGMTMSQFIELCILLGCDYLEPLKGIGPKSALKLMKEHGSLELVLEHLRAKSAEKAKQNVKAAAKAAAAEEEEAEEDVESEDEVAPSDREGPGSEAEEDDRVDEDGKEKKKKKKDEKGKKVVRKGTGGVQVPDEWLWREAKKLFERPDVTPAADVELTWEAPDVDGLVDFLVRDKGFNEDRVRKGADKLTKMISAKQQGRLDSFFTARPKSPEKKAGSSSTKGASKGSSKATSSKGTKRKTEEKGGGGKKAKK